MQPERTKYVLQERGRLGELLTAETEEGRGHEGLSKKERRILRNKYDAPCAIYRYMDYDLYVTSSESRG
jgi:hypothetical protein